MPTRSPGLENSNSRLLITEVLRKVSNAKTKKEKIKLLQDNNSNALRQLLIWNFDESVVSMIPEGAVPYTPNDAPVGTHHTFGAGAGDSIVSLKVVRTTFIEKRDYVCTTPGRSFC